MQYNVNDLEVGQLAEEIQTVLEEREDWMSLRDIVAALDAEGEDGAREVVRDALDWDWMHRRSMVRRSVFRWAPGGQMFKAL